MSRSQANLLLLVVALIWGSAFVAQSEGMSGVGPFAFTGIRFLLGFGIVAPLAWREWRTLRVGDPAPRLKDFRGIGALGILLLLGAVFQQIGIVGTTVTNAGFLTALYVPLVPFLSWLLHRTRPHWSVWPSSLCCVAGAWLLSGATGFDLGQGDAWVIASSLFWALHVLFVGRVANKLAAPFLVAGGQFFVCGLLSLIFAALGEEITVAGIRHALAPIAYAGLVSVGIGFTAQVVGQRYAKPSDAAILLSAETLFAALFGFLMMGDRLNLAGVVGCLLIFASIVAVQLAPQPIPVQLPRS